MLKRHVTSVMGNFQVDEVKVKARIIRNRVKNGNLKGSKRQKSPHNVSAARLVQKACSTGYLTYLVGWLVIRANKLKHRKTGTQIAGLDLITRNQR